MSEYLHEREFSVRYSDVDFKDELKPSALLSFLQEAACTSGEELGFGYDDLRPLNYGFVVVSTCVEVVKPITLGELARVQTWPLPPRRVIFERDYRLFNQKGEVCANAASRWCLVDLQNMSLLTPDKLASHASCPYNPAQSLSPVWKVAKLGEDKRECARFTVKNSVCDHYLHANNARYADFFFDCFSMDELSARRVEQFIIVYHKQIQEGREVVLYRQDFEGQTVIEAFSDGALCTQFSVRFARA